MGGPYCLKKDTHCTVILNQLLNDSLFADVTLTTEGKSIKAHRIVLSLASSYFQRVLCKDPVVQNAIVFHDISFSELKNIVQFIYMGEVVVDACELESFMHTAEILEISSLCESNENIHNFGSVIPNRKQEAVAVSHKILPDTSRLHPSLPSKRLNDASPRPKNSTGFTWANEAKLIKVEPMEFLDSDLSEEHSAVPIDSKKIKSNRESNIYGGKPSTSNQKAETNTNWGDPNVDIEENQGSLQETLSNVSEHCENEQWSTTDGNDDLNDESPVPKSDIVSSISITPSVESVGFEEAQISALTYARGRIYPSPAQENLQKLIYRTEVEVNELYAKIENGLGTEGENNELDVKINALHNYKKLLKCKVNAARRSMKSREKRKKIRDTFISPLAVVSNHKK